MNRTFTGSADKGVQMSANAGPQNRSAERTPRVLVRRMLALAERAGLLILLVGVFVYFGTDPKTSTVFLSSLNMRNILADQAVVGLIAIAMIPPLTAGYFDLSVASTAGLSSIVFGSAIGTHGWSVAAGICLAITAALAVGVINGLLVATLQLNPFVVTLGMSTFLSGVAIWYTAGATIANGIPRGVGNWGATRLAGIPGPFVLLIIVALVTWYLLNHVPWGRHLESIGSNEPAARLIGIKVSRTLFGSFLLASTLAGIAGIILVTRTGSASSTAAPPFLFPAFAAVFLGATVFRPGHYNVFGTIVGVLFVAVSISGLSLAGADIWVAPVFDGAALIVAVALSTFLARVRQLSSSARGGTNGLNQLGA
jgi:ribose transport system permease protein